jgi:L,D-transpeptidase catalytic domain
VRSGEKVELHDEPGGKVIDTVGDQTEFGSRMAFSVQRTDGVWAGVPTPYFENGRLAWMRLDSRRLKAFTVHYEVEVDLSDFRTDLMRRGKVIKSFPVSIGMPEAPTPTGRFAVTDTFRGNLNPAYGCCAVALTARQTRLPSGWLGGDRIAIHGTSGTLGAEISHGCVRAADPDVSELVNRLPPGTPVTIRQ